MGRLPKKVINNDSSINTRVDIPSPLWKLAEEVGKILKVKSAEPAHLGLRMFFEQIAAMIENGDVKFLGSAMFENALVRLRNANLGILARDIDQIDLTKLHMTPKTKSGFVGVYAYGGGFRAMGKTLMGGIKVIATCKTAEEAAQRRFLYYKQNNLAYGPLEEEMERWRKDGGRAMSCQGYSDEQLVDAIEQHCRMSGRYEEVFGAPNSLVPKKSKLPIPHPDFVKGQQLADTAIGFEDGALPSELNE